MVGLKLVGGSGARLPWADSGEAPDGQEEPRGHARKQAEVAATQRRSGTTRAATLFGVAALLTLVAGVTIERSGERFVGGLGLSGVIFGSTVLAAATSSRSRRRGWPRPGVGTTSSRWDVFGGNAFLPVLFLLVTPISGRRCCPRPRPATSF